MWCICTRPSTTDIPGIAKLSWNLLEIVVKSQSLSTNVLILSVVVRARWQFNVLLAALLVCCRCSHDIFVVCKTWSFSTFSELKMSSEIYWKLCRELSLVAAGTSCLSEGPSCCTKYDWVTDSQGSYRSGKTGKSLGILVVRHSGGNSFAKSGKMKKWCHQMSDFQAKMRQICCPLGLRPRPRWGSLQRSPRPPSCT